MRVYLRFFAVFGVVALIVFCVSRVGYCLGREFAFRHCFVANLELEGVLIMPYINKDLFKEGCRKHWFERTLAIYGRVLDGNYEYHDSSVYTDEVLYSKVHALELDVQSFINSKGTLERSDLNVERKEEER